jgi:hypothetical protein
MILTWLLALAISTDVIIVSVPPRGDVSVAVTPTGKVELKRDGNVTRVKLEIDKLRLWSTVGPSVYCYVVWAVSPEGVFDNLGELAIDRTDGFIESTTRFDQAGIFVTAEPHYMVDRPSAHVVYRSQAPRDVNIRRVTIPVQVGAFDYANIHLPPDADAPSLIHQARAAFQIAINGGAERWAESELRLARVALETMEEMRRRQAPYDIVSTTAHETVRRSQLASVISRERATQMALEEVEDEVGRLSEEQEKLEIRIREITEQLSAANNQIRTLSGQVTASERTNTELNQQREQAETALRAAERELERVRRQQEGFQSKLSVKLQPEHFDDIGLTPAGRDVLARVTGIAGVIPGPITVEGFPSDAAFQAVMLYLSEAGIPYDRIITRR